MIPFKLFKYMYLRGLICYIFINFITKYVGIFIRKLVPFINRLVVNSHFWPFFIALLYNVCLITFISNITILKKYKKIEIITDIKSITWSFVWDILLLESLIVIIISEILFVLLLIIPKNSVINNIISSENITNIVAYLIWIILQYFILNWFLEKYYKLKIKFKENNDKCNN